MAQFPKAIWVKAVEQKCAECIYDPGQTGTWRMQVKDCTALDCPLYPIRPLPECEKHVSDPVIPNLVRQRQQEWKE